MIGLKKVIAPIDDTSFDEICSFETENYIGIFVDDLPRIHETGFVVMPKHDGEFSIFCILTPETLEDLDARTFNVTEEHIQNVSLSRCLKVEIDEEV